MSAANLKKYKFSIETVFSNNDIYVKRTAYKNALYLYIYKKSLLGDSLLVGLKVSVYE